MDRFVRVDGCTVFSLVERKKQWQREAEEQRARDADAEVPAGHRLMHDDERLQTLDHVQMSTYNMTHCLLTLSVTTDSVILTSSH